MSAFIECRVCRDRIILRDDAGVSDEALAKHFRSNGWTIQPTRCPRHAGLAGALRTWAARMSRAQCTADHDPKPILEPAGIQSGGGMRLGGRGVAAVTIAPRKEFCQIHSHYWYTDGPEAKLTAQ